MASGASSLGTAVIKFMADPSGFEKGLKTMSGGLQKFSGGLDKVAKKMGNTGKAALKMGGVLAGIFAGALKSAADFETKFAEVQTLLGNTSTAELVELQDGLDEISRTMGVDIITATEGMYQAISAGIPKGNVLEFLDVASNVAIAGVSDVATSVGLLTKVINAYGGKLSDLGDESERATRISDVMFSVVKDGVLNFSELSSAMGKVVSTAAASNISIEELGAGFATLTKGALNADIAATSFNALLLEMLEPQAANAAAMDRLNIKYRDFQTGAITFTELMQQITDKTKGSALAMGEVIGSREALKAALIFSADGAKVFNSALENTTNSLGAANEAADILKETLSFKFKNAMNSAKSSFRELGTRLQPGFTKVLEDVQKHLDTLKNWMDENPNKFQVIVDNAVTGMSAALIGGGLLIAGEKVANMFTGVAASVIALSLAWPAIIAAGPVIVAGFGAVLAVIGPLVVALAAITLLLAPILPMLFSTMDAVDQLAESETALKEKNEELLDSMKGASDVFDKRIEQIKAMDDAEEQHAARIKLSQDVQAEATNALVKNIQLELEMLLGKKATQEQVLQAARNALFLENDARLASLAVVGEITQQQLAHMETLTTAEKTTALERIATEAGFLAVRSALMQEGTETLQEELGISTETWASYRESLTKELATIAEQERAAFEATKDITGMTRAEIITRNSIWQNLVTARQSVTTKLGQLSEEMGKQSVARIATENDLGDVFDASQVKAQVAMEKSAEIFKASGAKIREDIISTSDLYVTRWNALPGEQKDAIDLLVGGLEKFGADHSEIVGAINNRLFALSPGSTPDGTHAPGSTASPLGRAMDDFSRYTSGVDEVNRRLSVQTQIAAQTWANYADTHEIIMGRIFRNTAQAMDMSVRRSPSILDRMQTSANTASDIDKAMVRKRIELFESFYADQIKLLKNFFSTGASLQTTEEFGPFGGREEVKIHEGPEGLDPAVLLKMLNQLDLLKKLISDKGITDFLATLTGGEGAGFTLMPQRAAGNALAGVLPLLMGQQLAPVSDPFISDAIRGTIQGINTGDLHAATTVDAEASDSGDTFIIQIENLRSREDIEELVGEIVDAKRRSQFARR